MTGTSIAAEIAAAYEEVGREVGDGIGAVRVIIRRAGPPTGTPSAPRPGQPIDHVFTAKPADAEYTRKTGTALEAGERVYSLVNHGIQIEPSATDTLVIDGQEWPAVEVVPMNPGGHALSWLVKVRR